MSGAEWANGYRAGEEGKMKYAETMVFLERQRIIKLLEELIKNINGENNDESK